VHGDVLFNYFFILGNQSVEGGIPGPSHGSTELNQEQQGELEFTYLLVVRAPLQTATT